MKVVYIAGPIGNAGTWVREQNIRRAEALALEVWKLGAAAVCVHAAGRFYDEKQGVDWLKGDFEILSRCDAVLCTPDWSKSPGARQEVKLADEKNIPVFVNLGSLARWLDHGP